MNKILVGLIVLLGVSLANAQDYKHVEPKTEILEMKITSVGFNDNSVYGYSKGFWEYWANDGETTQAGNSYHGISFKEVHKGDLIKVNIHTTEGRLYTPIIVELRAESNE